MALHDPVLLGPGPSTPYPEALEAFSRPLLGHLDPAFLSLMDEVSHRLRQVFVTENALTFAVSGTGSAGMEASFVNVVSPGDVVVVAVNGVFGQRMCDVAARCGAEVIPVEHEWGQPVDPERVRAAHPSPHVIAMVHAETSTGVRSDVAWLGENKGDALLLVDCVTSLGGIEVDVDGWAIDIAYSGTQKCLGVPPGLAPLTVSERAAARIVERPQSWYLDLNMLKRYVTGGEARAYHHTAPISMMYSLHAGLGRVLEEGLPTVFERHQAAGDALQQGLVERGFELFAADGSRLPQLTSVRVPAHSAGIGEADLRRQLLDDYGIEVGGGLGELAGIGWRIGLMGHGASRRNVAMVLAAIDELFG